MKRKQRHVDSHVLVARVGHTWLHTAPATQPHRRASLPTVMAPVGLRHELSSSQGVVFIHSSAAVRHPIIKNLTYTPADAQPPFSCRVPSVWQAAVLRQ